MNDITLTLAVPYDGHDADDTITVGRSTANYLLRTGRARLELPTAKREQARTRRQTQQTALPGTELATATDAVVTPDEK